MCAADKTGQEPEQLRKAVKSALQAAIDHQMLSLALPLISSGIFGCPVPLAAQVVVAAVNKFLEQLGPATQDCLKVLLPCPHSQLCRHNAAVIATTQTQLLSGVCR